MLKRDTIMNAIQFRKTGGLIIEGGFSPATWAKYQEKLDPLAEMIPNSFYDFKAPYNDGNYTVFPPSYNVGDVYTDPWGCEWKCEVGGMQGIITKFPLASWDDYDNYEFPDPLTTFDLTVNKDFSISGFRDYCKMSRENEIFTVAGGERLWERVHFLRGYENAMVDLGSGEPRIRDLINRIADYNIENVKKYLDSDVDCIAFQDDWGEQNRLMISPKMWYEYFFDAYKRTFDVVKAAGKKIYFHTDGYLLPVIQGFKDAGVDIINLQSGCISLPEMKKACHKNICVSVDIDRQHYMVYATCEELKQHVRDIYNVMDAENGGVWVKYDVYPDVDLDHIRALAEVLQELTAKN